MRESAIFTLYDLRGKRQETIKHWIGTMGSSSFITCYTLIVRQGLVHAFNCLNEIKGATF